MNKKQDGGFSLIEVVLAMVILALIVVPTCTSLVLSFRVNAKADALLQAQLAVSSAVEELMADGIVVGDVLEIAEDNYGIKLNDDGTIKEDLFPDVKVNVTAEEACYKVVVKDNQGLVEVVTHIRKVGDTQ